jgi:hypothetical protein
MYTFNMLLLIHIIIASGGLVCSGLSFINPSIFKFKLSFVLTLLTLLSGTFLVFQTHSNLQSACLSGIAYIGAIAFLLSSAQLKLQKSKNNN